VSQRSERQSEQLWSPLTANGPPSRWTPVRKAMVAQAILAGKLHKGTARRRFELAEEELSGWIAVYREHGTLGLRTTRLQQYRERTGC